MLQPICFIFCDIDSKCRIYSCRPIHFRVWLNKVISHFPGATFVKINKGWVTNQLQSVLCSPLLAEMWLVVPHLVCTCTLYTQYSWAEFVYKYGKVLKICVLRCFYTIFVHYRFFFFRLNFTNYVNTLLTTKN